MCGARRQSVRTPLSSSQLIFSVPSCSGAYIQPRYPVWEMGLRHTEHNAALFAFCYCTINWMVVGLSALFSEVKTQSLVAIGGSKPGDKTLRFSVVKQFEPCSALFLALISLWNVIYLSSRLWLAGLTRQRCFWTPSLEPRHRLGRELKPEVFWADHCQLINWFKSRLSYRSGYLQSRG